MTWDILTRTYILRLLKIVTKWTNKNGHNSYSWRKHGNYQWGHSARFRLSKKYRKREKKNCEHENKASYSVKYKLNTQRLKLLYPFQLPRKRKSKAGIAFIAKADRLTPMPESTKRQPEDTCQICDIASHVCVINVHCFTVDFTFRDSKRYQNQNGWKKPDKRADLVYLSNNTIILLWSSRSTSDALRDSRCWIYMLHEPMGTTWAISVTAITKDGETIWAKFEHKLYGHYTRTLTIGHRWL